MFVCNHVDVPFPGAVISPAVRPAPNVGDPWYPPSVYVWPDPVSGWVQVYQHTLSGFYTGFMDLDRFNIVAGADPNTGFPPAQIGAIPVPPASQLNGANVTATFEATRVMVPSPPDYTQSPVMIRVNNAREVNQLTLGQFCGSARMLHADLRRSHRAVFRRPRRDKQRRLVAEHLKSGERRDL